MTHDEPANEGLSKEGENEDGDGLCWLGMVGLTLTANHGIQCGPLCRGLLDRTSPRNPLPTYHRRRKGMGPGPLEPIPFCYLLWAETLWAQAMNSSVVIPRFAKLHTAQHGTTLASSYPCWLSERSIPE